MAPRSPAAMRDRTALALGDPDRGMPQRLADFALEVADARLARVALDDVAQRLVGDLDLAGLEARSPSSAARTR